ncbi:histidine kinase 5 isoform X2 [Selaginella moellendorffii]|uniref:histidine kinase 5 isoform X2 n=1 Tax=Selaginella moellendorffii TaxID=88036 RepID=UPI000D1C36A7|nr:histidine kinase 5 isoform X2 [Selaginella moellendorffii]|eukprot:XP_024515454.1 histidine kinase 5 isoform X2 [Selaginella moellendorffii]
MPNVGDERSKIKEVRRRIDHTISSLRGIWLCAIITIKLEAGIDHRVHSQDELGSLEKRSSMWPPDLNWEKRLSQKPDNVSLAGEAGIADSSYLSSLVGSTNVGVGQLSGLARQWESSHSNAVQLLKEEMESLSSQRSEAESKRRRILDEESFYAAASRDNRSVLRGSGTLEEQVKRQVSGVPPLVGVLPPPSLDDSKVGTVEKEWRAPPPPPPGTLEGDGRGNAAACSCERRGSFGLEEGGEGYGDQVEHWKSKAWKFNQLLGESLQREEILIKKLEEKSKRLEAVKPMVTELQNQLERVDNFLHFVLRNAPIFLSHQDKDLKYRFMYNNHPAWQSEVIGKTDLELLPGPGGTMTHNFKKEVLRRGCPAKREFVYDTVEFGYKVFLICAEPVFSKGGQTIGVNIVSMDVTEEAANREKLIRLREEEAVQKAMETQLHKTMRITEETMKAKQLLATMSHEIRSPLSGVVSMAEILAATNLDPEQQNLVDIMVSSGDLVMQLINDILDLSKVESGAMKLEATKFRPREVLKNVLQIAAASMQKRDLNLEGFVSAEVPFEVIADVLRVRQILTNLVSNAIKFTRQGSVRVEIEISNKKLPHKQNGSIVDSNELQTPCSSSITSPATTTPTVPQWVNNDTVWLECRIVDTGIGIPDTALPFLFTKYMQVSETHARKYGGTGLGLAICKQLVELMGGKLKVNSEENKGSTFMFTLPCKLCGSNGTNQASSHFSFSTAAMAARRKSSGTRGSSVNKRISGNNGESVSSRKSSSSPPHRNGEASGKATTKIDAPAPATSTATTIGGNAAKLKVLLAEDNKVNIMVAQSMLRRMGLEATVVNDGAEAVEAIKRDYFDLILMDVIMPVMDGLEATRLIRDTQGNRDGQGKRSTIIAMTANALPENVAECYTHGMDSFIAKPVTFSKLQQAIQQFFPPSLPSPSPSSSSSSPSPKPR